MGGTHRGTKNPYLDFGVIWLLGKRDLARLKINFNDYFK
jgi:hypothetical protein